MGQILSTYDSILYGMLALGRVVSFHVLASRFSPLIDWVQLGKRTTVKVQLGVRIYWVKLGGIEETDLKESVQDWFTVQYSVISWAP